MGLQRCLDLGFHFENSGIYINRGLQAHRSIRLDSSYNEQRQR